MWELYKAFGPEDGVRGRRAHAILPRTTDRAMPHVWEMLQRLGRAGDRAAGAPDRLWRRCSRRACSRSRIAAVGWVIGVVVGLLLALLMSRFRIAEAAVLPWVVLSQTVPLIAIAPLVRRWGAQIEIGGFVWRASTRWP